MLTPTSFCHHTRTQYSEEGRQIPLSSCQLRLVCVPLHPVSVPRPIWIINHFFFKVLLISISWNILWYFFKKICVFFMFWLLNIWNIAFLHAKALRCAQKHWATNTLAQNVRVSLQPELALVPSLLSLAFFLYALFIWNITLIQCA